MDRQGQLIGCCVFSFSCLYISTYRKKIPWHISQRKEKDACTNADICQDSIRILDTAWFPEVVLIIHNPLMTETLCVNTDTSSYMDVCHLQKKKEKKQNAELENKEKILVFHKHCNDKSLHMIWKHKQIHTHTHTHTHTSVHTSTHSVQIYFFAPSQSLLHQGFPGHVRQWH